MGVLSVFFYCYGSHRVLHLLTQSCPTRRSSDLFWFDEVPADKGFDRDAALDAVIKAHFGVLLETLIRTDAKGCRDDPRTLLASVIVIDQFSRNIHRGQAQAFAADPLAL